MGVLGGVIVLKSGLRILIRALKVPFLGPPKCQKLVILAFLPGLAGLFGALLVGRLVVVARGLYLARHLFTLFERYRWSYKIFYCWSFPKVCVS